MVYDSQKTALRNIVAGLPWKQEGKYWVCEQPYDFDKYESVSKELGEEICNDLGFHIAASARDVFHIAMNLAAPEKFKKYDIEYDFLLSGDQRKALENIGALKWNADENGRLLFERLVDAREYSACRQAIGDKAASALKLRTNPNYEVNRPMMIDFEEALKLFDFFKIPHDFSQFAKRLGKIKLTPQDQKFLRALKISMDGDGGHSI